MDTTHSSTHTLSLHDALPIFDSIRPDTSRRPLTKADSARLDSAKVKELIKWAAEDSVMTALRSEEHTSELQSHHDLVCRLLLEKKKKPITATLRCSVYSASVS